MEGTMFAARTKNLNTLSFHHTSRPLADGEAIPSMPTLLEQIEACRFVTEQPAEEESGGDEYWDDEDESEDPEC
jgi:hypothetical protein